MSNLRIDHATEAMECATAAYKEYTQGSRQLAELHMAGAQMHATLALVEQQRITNVIALASMAEDDGKHEVLAGELGNAAVWTLATTKMIGPDDEIEVVNPDIAAALGIEVAS